jgi:two-component sensor histidine kinase
VQAPEAKAALGEAIGRVSAIANVHARLNAVGNVTDVEMGSYLGALCEDAARSGMIDAANCRVKIDADALVLPTSRATSVALIVTELLMNVAKYCGQAATIAHVVVRLRGSNAGMRLEVEDDGPGMPPDFDPELNAGLGLKIVLALSRQNGGDVRFEALHPGTRVVIEWPDSATDPPGR